ncbi:MAG: hypothetical protein HC828_07140 [Blastochloris sp.]|nr:hypothetical protein [Blastochloris sp.]
MFAKYRVNGGNWSHARLLPSGNLAPTGSTIDVADNVGAFVYRSTDGSGDVNWSGIQLQWDYATNGVNNNAVVDIQVFAVEMVYVPQEAFSVGPPFDGQANIVGEFYTLSPSPFFIRVPYQVQNEGAITVSNTSGNLYYATN